MRLFGRRVFLFGALTLVAALAVAGCQNPLDPLDKSDKIEGLSFVDFTATWDRWDSDPEFDGMVIGMDYKNEFNEGLAFHDKPHTVVIEFWTQLESGPDDALFKSKDKLLFSQSITYSNSDDDIRIPVEGYFGALSASGVDMTATEGVKCFVSLRVFPPQEFPRPELDVAQPDIVVYKRPTAEDVPNR